MSKFKHLQGLLDENELLRGELTDKDKDSHQVLVEIANQLKRVADALHQLKK